MEIDDFLKIVFDKTFNSSQGQYYELVIPSSEINTVKKAKTKRKVYSRTTSLGNKLTLVTNKGKTNLQDN